MHQYFQFLNLALFLTVARQNLDRHLENQND